MDVGVDEILAAPGQETIERFLEAWYGPRRREPGTVRGSVAPLPVQALASTLAGWPRAFRQNHLELDADLIDGRYRPVLTENQSVVEWAVDEADPEGPVWFRDPVAGEWLLEREPLPRFLLQAVLFEAVADLGWGGDGRYERPTGFLAPRFVPHPDARFIAGARVVAAAPDVAGRVLTGLAPLPYGAWRWPSEPATFYAGPDAVGCRWPNGGGWDVAVAARRAAVISGLASVPGVELTLEEDPDAEHADAEATLRSVQQQVWRRSGPVHRLPQDEFSRSMRRRLGPPGSA